MCQFLLASLLSLAAAAQPDAGLALTQEGEAFTVTGGHFALTFDAARGGEITHVRVNDGAAWQTVMGSGDATFPAFTLRNATDTYALARDAKAVAVVLEENPDRVRLSFTGYPRTETGAASAWQVCLTYEIYREGAVFADMQCHLREGEFVLHHAEVSFQTAEGVLKAPKFSDENVGTANGGFRSARVAFGMYPAKSYTNEVEVVCEYKQAMAGEPKATKEKGRYTWVLGSQEEVIKAPYSYHNRFAFGLAAAVNGPPKSRAVGHRVYHWVNWLDYEDWYPHNDQIDKMAANKGTMLILHHEYLLQRGRNGKPHAEYSALRNHDEMVRTIEYAHAKGLRVGLYMRGVEPYALNSAWWERFCKRNWDGLYVDWHGHGAVSWHEMKYGAESGVGDWHHSKDGSHVPARDYFLYTKRIREMVGPEGFLIGHQGSFSGGILPNLCFDAYLPGETSSDHHIFADADQAALKGMQGGCVCMPWMLDLGLYCNAEGAAKMAAWGFYPHLVMGISRDKKSAPFPLDPDDAMYAFVQPYWRVLAYVDSGKAWVYNLASQPQAAMTSSNSAITGVVYREEGGRYVVIVANLGEKPAQASLTLDAGLLGMQGEYKVERIDSETGKSAPAGESRGALKTSTLPQWGIEGFVLKNKAE